MHLSVAIPGVGGNPQTFWGTLGICTKSFSNSTYPGPMFFHKSYHCPSPGEHNSKGLPNCNIISCIIFNKRFNNNIYSKKKQLSTCFLHTARFSFIPCKPQNDNISTVTVACVHYTGLYAQSPQSDSFIFKMATVLKIPPVFPRASCL